MVKVERSFPAPESLAREAAKANGSYSEPDVTERLEKDFHNKCYICEMKGLQDPEVEHLLPHQNGKDKKRKFDWENLFWACRHCNNVKNQRKYDAGILNCCRRDPEEAIAFGLEEQRVWAQAKENGDQEAVLAAQLVVEVFNLCNTGMRVYKSKMRLEGLETEMNVLYSQLGRYRQNPDSRRILRTLRALLSRESAFAGFKRGYVREHLNEYPELKEYLE